MKDVRAINKKIVILLVIQQIYGNAFKKLITTYSEHLKDFSLWFTEGLWHIADLKAYDHILFLLVLFGGFQLKDWRKVLLLITAFTIGHSITLALSVLEIIRIRTVLVEFLIPCTILTTAIYNLVTLKRGNSQNIFLSFSMALFFGLIHGMGFSVLLKSLLGKASNIVGPLFSFNLGIEAGQILIIAAISVLTMITTKLLKITGYTWRFFISAAVFGVALVMAVERL